MAIEIKSPILLVGVGGVGASLAAAAKKNLGVNSLLISNDANDLNHPGCESVFVDAKPLLNPSPNSIRSALLRVQESIMFKLHCSSTVVVVGNLAGRAGVGIAPMITRMAKQAKKNVASFVIMPFKFEKNKLFGAGVALKRLKESSDCLVIVDNDAFLFNNPDLTPEACYGIINDAMLEALGSLVKGSLTEDVNVLSTSRASPNGAESALKDSIRMLYSEVDPENVKRAMIYVIGGDRVPVGVLNTMVNHVHTILGKSGVEVGLALSPSSSAQGVRVLLLASVLEQTRFDSYDPLSIIPADSVLDWDEIECDLALELDTSIPRID